MNGATTNFNLSKYRRQLETMPKPFNVSELPKVQVDYKGILAYAKNNGKTAAELTRKEMLMFITGDIKGLNEFYERTKHKE